MDVCECVNVTVYGTRTRARRDAEPAAVFLSRANQTCQKASSTAAMATTLAPAKVTRWRVFASC